MIKTLIMRVFSTFLFTSVTTISLSQDIKSLDYAAVMKKNHVESRTCKEVKFKGSSADTLMYGHELFDQKGRIISYTEYFAGGKVFAIYEYVYSDKNKVLQNTIKHTFNDFIPMEFNLTYDASNRVIARQLPSPIRNFWEKETFTYTSSGVMIKSEQWYNQGGTLQALDHNDYPPNLTPRDNSLTYLHDQRGLLVLHQLYNNRGIVERSRKYDYSFFDVE